MDVKVEITIKNEFEQISRSVSELKDFDNDCILDGTTTVIDEIIQHVYQAILALGYTPETVDKYINREGI